MYLVVFAFLAVFATIAPAVAQQNPPAEDLTKLSLEELMKVNVSVTSAAKRSQRLNDVAAAAYVLTADDIRRSGARTIPDALRLVPGMQVSQIDANKWAVSARGFNSRFSNKLLVLMDGRSIYTPLFSGVVWDLHNIVPEDIDRIEVIRGPGASLWGSNAVNGVINIITKNAAETQGGLATMGGGTHHRGFGSVRWGGRFGENTYWRGSLQGEAREALNRVDGGSDSPMSRSGTLGMRLDSRQGDNNFHLSGGYFDGRAGETLNRFNFTAPLKRPHGTRASGEVAHVLGRWTHALSDRFDIELQGYVSHQKAETAISALADTFDLELQHRFAAGDSHQLVWGTGYRLRKTELIGSEDIPFNQATRTTGVFSAFVQDEITLVPKQLRFTIGSRFEHHPFTGFNVQPNARLSWTPNDRHSLWASVARAVRTPSIGERDSRSAIADIVTDRTTGLPLVLQNQGAARVASETIVAFEVGYRIRVTPRFFVDFAAFYNIYDNLLSGHVGNPQLVFGPPTRIVVPIAGKYTTEGRTYGFELATEWQPANELRVRAGYSLLRISLDSNQTGAVLDTPGRSPRHQGFIHASYDVSPTVKFDAVMRGASALTAFAGVNAYLTADLRVAWQATDGLELSLSGSNLLGGERIEFVPDLISLVPTKVGPTVYGKATFKF